MVAISNDALLKAIPVVSNYLSAHSDEYSRIFLPDSFFKIFYSMRMVFKHFFLKVSLKWKSHECFNLVNAQATSCHPSKRPGALGIVVAASSLNLNWKNWVMRTILVISGSNRMGLRPIPLEFQWRNYDKCFQNAWSLGLVTWSGLRIH